MNFSAHLYWLSLRLRRVRCIECRGPLPRASMDRVYGGTVCSLKCWTQYVEQCIVDAAQGAVD